jgi:hypothetical protein
MLSTKTGNRERLTNGGRTSRASRGHSRVRSQAFLDARHLQLELDDALLPCRQLLMMLLIKLLDLNSVLALECSAGRLE